MEFKELTDKTMELFGLTDPSQLGFAVRSACDDHAKLKTFKELVGGDLSVDWMQMIYQYYLADRKDKKQDYTPKTLAALMGRLSGNSDRIVDMCAGSGALIIQKWADNHDLRFTAIEIDENVIPFLIFNMVLRNIRCRIFQMSALGEIAPEKAWDIVKGEEFGNITDFKSSV